MSNDQVLQQFDRLSVWNRGDQRAPHKPLLVLYALGRWAAGDRVDFPYGDIDRDLTALLKEFGPPRGAHHPEYPFWWLRSDGVWVVRSDEPLGPFQGGAGPSKGELVTRGARAAFSDPGKTALSADPKLIPEIAARLLERHFPESIHTDILSAVGLSLAPYGPAGRKRASQFRQRVLTAYEWRCAVCGFDVRLGSVSIALDAAHIRWHQAGGPGEESNGLALCVLHHTTFDLGAFSVDEAGVLLVSDQANGTAGFRGVAIAAPRKALAPAPAARTPASPGLRRLARP